MEQIVFALPDRETVRRVLRGHYKALLAILENIVLTESQKIERLDFLGVDTDNLLFDFWRPNYSGFGPLSQICGRNAFLDCYIKDDEFDLLSLRGEGVVKHTIPVVNKDGKGCEITFFIVDKRFNSRTFEGYDLINELFALGYLSALEKAIKDIQPENLEGSYKGVLKSPETTSAQVYS